MTATIGYNALALRPGGSGVQTYIAQLLAGLATARPPALSVARVQADAVGELPVGMRTVVTPVCSGAQRAVRGALPLPGVDLVHGLDVDLPLVGQVPTVATVHDLSVFDTPWAFSRGRALAEQQLLRLALRRADELVAVSGYTASRLQERFGRTATVVPLAASPDMRPAAPQDVARVRERYRLPAQFVLQVGTVEPRKDVATLAAAARAAGCPVVLAGRVGAALPAGVSALGYVDRADLPALYGAATVVAYVSLYEGFGLPPLEAMACGAPVVATSVGALPDLVPGCVLVRPGDVDGLTAALTALLRDGDARRQLAQQGLQRAACFTWDATVEGTLAVYRGLGVAV